MPRPINNNEKNLSYIEKEFASILFDKEHGASYLASNLGKRIIELGLNQQPSEEVLPQLNYLLKILKKEHPALIMLQNLVIQLIQGVEKEGSSKIPEFIDSFFQKEEKTVATAIDFLKVLSFSRVITMSHSSTLIKTFNGLDFSPEFYVLESNPGGEGRLMAKELEKKGYEVHLIPDLSFSLFITQDSVVITGFDQLSFKFFVNKVGSTPLMVTSKFMGAETVIIGSSNKFTYEIVLPEKKTVFQGVELSVFEKTPLEHVSFVVTDEGVNRGRGIG